MALRKRHRESEVSTDSLSDIMFFLLLFFLILSTMVSPNAIQVNLPSSDNTTPPPQNKVIHLGINEKRMCFVEQTPTEFGNLENVLKILGFAHKKNAKRTLQNNFINLCDALLIWVLALYTLFLQASESIVAYS